MANKKYEEARKVISRFAKSKGQILSDEAWAGILKVETEKVSCYFYPSNLVFRRSLFKFKHHQWSNFFRQLAIVSTIPKYKSLM